MNISKRITAGLFTICWCGSAYGAGPPPLDRPTPPPCCADGVCYPNPVWGSYQRRWRRWPTEALEPTPAGPVPPGRLTPGADADIPTYEPPRMEEEDRRAPPPSKPTEQPAREGEEEDATGGAAPRTSPMPRPAGTPDSTGFPFEDDAPGTETPPGLPFDMPTPPPPGLRTPSTEPPGLGEPTTQPPAGSPFGPPTAPPAGSPLGSPTGDLDPPPAPPTFSAPSQSTASVSAGPEFRAAVRPVAAPRQRQAAPARAKSSNDPPPALPLTLAGGAY